jgi:outer membrane protein assembly factor BamB
MWRAKAAESNGTTSAAGGLLITGSSGAERTTVEALRLEDGLPAWWYDSRLIFNDVACRDGVVFVASSGRAHSGRNSPAQVVALRAHDGTPLWRTKTAQIRRRMAAIRLVCGVQGLLRWGDLSRAWNTARSLELAGYTNLAVGDDVVLACTGPVIFAFSMPSGALRWAFPTLTGGQNHLIKAHGDTIYIRSNQSAIEALDLRMGKVRWSSDRDFNVETLAASDTDVHICGGSAHGPFLASLRAVDGARERTRPLRSGEALAALMDDGTAYLMRESCLCSVRLVNGEEAWHSLPLCDAPEYSGAFTHSAVRVAVGERVVFYGYESAEAESRSLIVGGLNAYTGAALWEWRGPEKPLGLQLLAAHGNVYVLASTGTFALRGVDGQLLWQAPGGVSIGRAVLSIGA